MSSTSLYTSLPLDESRSEIRLLEIISDGSNATVECKLSVASLKDKPAFTALSYVWGDPKVTEDIKVNNHVVPVTTNLTSALKHAKFLWSSNFPDRDPMNFRL